MRRRTVIILAILVLLTALAALFAFRGCRSGPPHLSDLMLDETLYGHLTEGRTEDPALISGLRCNGYDLPAAGGDYYYSIVEDDPAGMDPLVEILGGESVSLAFAPRKLDRALLRSGDGLPFIACTDSAYCTGVLYPTTLPVMQITVTEPDESGSREVLDREPREAQMLLFDNRAELPGDDRVNRSALTVRVRGNTSAALPKLSYRLSLYRGDDGQSRHNNLPLLGMRSDEDWILLSNGGDSEAIRNCLSSNLWYACCAANNTLDVQPGVECRYVELLMNGQYQGLYSLTYPLDRKAVGLPDEGFYYRGVSYLETTSEMLRMASNETVIGGWELRHPSGEDAAGRACWTCLADFFEHFYEDDAPYTWFNAHLDRKNFVDLHLFLSLLAALDNYYKNNNVIAYPQADGSWRYLMAPWDLDLTLGHDYSAEETWRVSPKRIPPDTQYTPWPPAVADLMRTPDFHRAILERWQTLRDGDWSDRALTSLLDDYERKIYGSGAMAREHRRWPDEPGSEDLSELRAWLRARLGYLDRYFAQAPGQ